MANVSVSILGNKKLEKHLRNVSDPEKLFDPDFKRGVIDVTKRLIKKTPFRTGDLARHWQAPKRIGLSNWRVSNDLLASNSKIPLAAIIELGRKTAFPKK